MKYANLENDHLMRVKERTEAELTCAISKADFGLGSVVEGQRNKRERFYIYPVCDCITSGGNLEGEGGFLGHRVRSH
jgi:hypothetical protein